MTVGFIPITAIIEGVQNEPSEERALLVNIAHITLLGDPDPRTRERNPNVGAVLGVLESGGRSPEFDLVNVKESLDQLRQRITLAGGKVV